jgi:SARP family transcriptional regulator, regulator of embCAB operon
MLRVYLTGRICAEIGVELAIHEREFRGRQMRTAFAFLVRHLRTVSRDDLALVVWPHEIPPAWESGLSALLSKLRSLMSAMPRPARPILTNGFAQYQLRLPDDCWVDVEAAAEAVDRAEVALRGGNPRAAFGSATAAAAISRRPFLTGETGPWVEEERSRLARQLVRSLVCLSNVWLASGEPLLAIEAANEAISVSPGTEDAHRLLMRANAAARNKMEAFEAYRRLRQMLAEWTGSDPSDETERVYVELL